MEELSLEKIVKSLTDVKLDMGRFFDQLEENSTNQYKKLIDIQKAIECEKNNLEEIHSIQVNADSLAALIEAQKRQKEDFEEEMENEKYEFESEMEDKKANWEEEKKAVEKELQEYEKNIKIKREREEEEYKYNLEKTRKKERDAFDIKQSTLERELEEKKNKIEEQLSKREEQIKLKEDEYLSLKNKVDNFATELENSVKEVEKRTTDNLAKEYDYKNSLMQKEMDGDRKLYDQKIASLEAKIKEQKILIDELTNRAKDASTQVQNIALKAVEGAFPRERTLKENLKKEEGV
jgi:hypothetical protein